MDTLPIIYLVYMFISLYMLNFFLIIYFKHRKDFFTSPETNKKYSVSFVVPAYNEGKTIEDTVKHIFDIDYAYIKQVIVVNDCSTDDTKQILKKLKKKYKKLVVINNKVNLGNAAKSQNVGLKYVKGDLIAIVDGDSFPAQDSLKKMVGFFDDPKVGAVTVPVLARNKNKFIEKLQALEYVAISFGRKLLEYVDAIYVTPGPLALYRKEALIGIGGFDESNLTQDIEATWSITSRGWDRKMALSTNVTSQVPDRFWAWWKQRRRWNIGGLQCIWKYRKSVFRKSMLGYFIIPFFVISLFLGLIGLMIFFYLLFTNILSKFLFTKYSIIAGTPVISMQDFYITPSFLNYLGVVMFVLGFVYLILILYTLKEKIFVKENILNMPFYLVVYLMVYPFVLVDSIYHWGFGSKKWR